MNELEFNSLLIGEVHSFGPGPKYIVLGPPHDPSLNGTHLRIMVLGQEEELDYRIESIKTDPLAS